MTMISRIRKAKGISQIQLAQLLGVHKQTLYRWEKGVTQPNSGELLAIANILGVPVDQLLNADSTPVQNQSVPPLLDRDIHISQHNTGDYVQQIGIATAPIIQNPDPAQDTPPESRISNAVKAALFLRAEHPEIFALLTSPANYSDAQILGMAEFLQKTPPA